MNENNGIGSGDERKRPWKPSPSNQTKKKAKHWSPLAALENDGSSEEDRDVKDCQRQERDSLTTPRATETAGASSGSPSAESCAVQQPRNAVDRCKEAEANSTNGEGEDLDEEVVAVEGEARVSKSSDVAEIALRGAANKQGDDLPAADDEHEYSPHSVTSEYSDVLSSFLSTPFDGKAMLDLHKLKEGTELDRKTTLSRKDSLQRWVSSSRDYVPIIPQKVFIKFTRASIQKGSTRETIPTSSAAMRANVSSFLVQEGQNLGNPASFLDDASIISNRRQSSIIHQPTTVHQPSTKQPQTQHLLSHLTQFQPSNGYGLAQQQNSYNATPLLNSYTHFSQTELAYQQLVNEQLIKEHLLNEQRIKEQLIHEQRIKERIHEQRINEQLIHEWQRSQFCAAAAAAFHHAGTPNNNSYNDVEFAAVAQAILGAAAPAPAPPAIHDITAPIQDSAAYFQPHAQAHVLASGERSLPTHEYQSQSSLYNSYASNTTSINNQALPQFSAGYADTQSNMKSRMCPGGNTTPVFNPSLPLNGQGAQAIPNTSFLSNSNHSHSSVMASYHAQVNNPHTAPKIAMSSKEINASAVNVQTTAKMPVAFGFHLNDNDASKHMAQAAAQRWKAQGEKATKAKGTSLRVSIDGKHGNSICFTPKVAKTPMSGTTTPKTPKTPAILLSTEATPNLPTGWVSKTFQRTSGKSAGHHDTYFYSPQKGFRFRSMKSCKTFLQILDEPRVDGNESSALKVYKERGHRF